MAVLVNLPLGIRHRRAGLKVIVRIEPGESAPAIPADISAAADLRQKRQHHEDAHRHVERDSDLIVAKVADVSGEVHKVLCRSMPVRIISVHIVIGLCLFSCHQSASARRFLSDSAII
jgi:hypothetical protein